MPKFSPRARRVIPLAILALLSACLLVVVGVRAVRAYQEIRFAERLRAGEGLGVRPWMTIPYISRTYGVPESDLYAALGITPTERERNASLKILSVSTGRNLAADMDTLNAVIAAKGKQPPPPPGMPRRPTPRPAP